VYLWHSCSAACRWHYRHARYIELYRAVCALLFGLGIIVDDAIVVIENTHRIYNNGKVKVTRAAKEAAGEVFIPVLAGTLTTLAPFFPLLLWKGLIGKFMIYLPTMLILTLAASLIVAFIMNPVFAVSFMRPEGREYEEKKSLIFKKPLFWTVIAFGLLFNLAGWHGLGKFPFNNGRIDDIEPLCIARHHPCFPGKNIAGIDEPL
jgi:hypothetical protein